MMRACVIRCAVALSLFSSLAGCVYAPQPVYAYDPYDPGQRAVAGGLVGAGAGAAIGGIAGGGRGAAIGALAGGALGAAAGASTAPEPPYQGGYYYDGF